MGLMFLLFAAVFAADAARAIVAITRRLASSDAIDPGRRMFIARLSATAIAVLVAGLGGAALRSALRSVDVRRIRVKLERLPRGQHGFTLVQLTDVHVGPTIGREFIDDIVRRTNALEPDLIAITGDLVDGSVEQLRDAVAPLAGLRARHGVFFVTGNHEYFSGAEPWFNELARLGIRVLRNECVSIGAADASFDLGGIDDHSAGRYGGLEPAAAVSRALAGRDRSRELVLLAHQPRSLLMAEPFGVGLQLSGHTHGGQIWPFKYLVRLQQPFVEGLHRRGDAQIYVSRGTGYWGPPMRLAAPAEVTRIELALADATSRPI
jgi:predicted MPP superfamily phosphohydrolase